MVKRENMKTASEVDLWEMIYGEGSHDVWKDGMANASMICDAVNKKWSDFCDDEEEDIQSYLSAVQAEEGTSELIKFDHNGYVTVIWVHNAIVNKLASWCSVKFAVKINGITYDYMCGRLTTEGSKAAAAGFKG